MADDIGEPARHLVKLVKPLRVTPGSRVNLAADFDPRRLIGVRR